MLMDVVNLRRGAIGGAWSALLVCALLVAAAPAAHGQYTGTLRIFVIEPDSRWDYDEGGEQIHQAFLDFAMVQSLNITSGATAEYSLTWDASDNGWTSITPDNIEVAAGVYDGFGVQQDAFPPYGYYFVAYYCDASATATPGVPGANDTTGGFTHSVLCEEASTTDCENCPGVSHDLGEIVQSGDYAFSYVALVKDVNSEAEERVEVDYNMPFRPDCFFDGGYQVAPGDQGEEVFRPLIEAAGAREGNDVDVVVRMDQSGDDAYDIVVRIGHAVAANADPAAPTTLSGPSGGEADEDLTFEASETDTEGDDLYYQFDWGDGKGSSDWLGPYSSGATCSADHAYPAEATYGVTVRTKDVYGAVSDWSDPLEVEIGGTVCCNVRGDTNGDGVGPDIADLVHLTSYMFQPPSPPPAHECPPGSGYYPETDSNGDGVAPDIADLVHLTSYMFQPPSPELVPCP